MASAVADLEIGLQAMLGLKPPGVSGSRISSITTLCVSNVQSESVLIQKIYTHFKKAPGTHKLGVLYVVDSVTRKWLEQAKAQGQTINSSAPDGTFAAGVHRVTELMPVLMNDIIQTAPDDQKEKIKKLVDIWEKGQTFPAKLLESFKEKLNAPPAPKESTTPDGSPPPALLASGGGPAVPVIPNSTAIMEALANIARQNTTAAPSNPSLLAQEAPYHVPGGHGNFPQQPIAPIINQTQPAMSFLPTTQPVSMPAMPFSFPPQAPVQTGSSGNVPQNPYTGAVQPPTSSGLDPSMQQQLMLIKALAEQGVPFDKIPALIQGMTAGGSSALPMGMPSANPNPYSAPAGLSWGAPGADESRDRGGINDGVRSPNRYRERSRSRSPGRQHWDNRNSPRGGRDNFGRSSPGHGDRGRGRGDYRQRSPQGRHVRSRSPEQDMSRPTEKWVEYDPNLPAGHIKVLSRTLFVGGVTCSESELRGIFSRFGVVQTCIVNKEKRHAFVKMLTRKDAVHAKEAMEDTRKLEIPLRTRWGVGFGPRDCSDYSTGVSIIPIHKLTEADRKWMLTADFGGSGGKPIDTGLVVEEPDIEIGAGVSSKAISRRMQTDKGGNHGPKSTRGRDEEDLSRWRRNKDHDDNHDDKAGNGNGNDAPPFPFGLQTLPNGMPAFPPGFMFPAPDANGH